MSFMDLVEKIPESGCWIWMGNMMRGYGRTPRSQRRAHRESYELHCGPIPVGLAVLHRCDVKCCVNPSHLFLGTQTMNVADMVAKSRQKGGGRRLDEKTAAAIVSSPLSLRATARAFGVSKFSVIKYKALANGA